MDISKIARHYGGTISNGNAIIPTPGHSSRDRGTAIKPCASAPDGVLVACYNGDTADALAVKEMLRADGFLESRKRQAFAPAEQRSIRWADLAAKRKQLVAEEATSQNAREAWAGACHADPAQPYLVAKGLEPFGIRQSGNALLVPMVDANFHLWNVQRIKPDGSKLFCKGARTAGLFWPHATHLADGRPSDGPLVIGEGFATTAVIHAETGLGVVAAMTARNLEAVAVTMRGLFPERPIIIAADDDRHLAANIGLRVARKAADAAGGVLALPRPETCQEDSGADFADIPRDQVANRIFAALGGE